MISRLFCAALVVVSLCSCTAMDKLAGMGVVSERVSTFDHATVIEVSPNSLYDPGSAMGTPLQLGARWISTSPDYVALVLSYRSNVSGANPAFLGFSSLEINIDGQSMKYSTAGSTDLSDSGYNGVTGTVYTASRNAVVVPYTVLQRMVAARDCRLRIQTSSGYQDVLFSADHIPGGKATAIVSIRDFMAKVSASRSSG